MNLLGKSSDDVKTDFCYKYHIPESELDNLFNFLKFGKLSRKTLIIVVGIISIIIGLSFLLSMASSAVNDQFPLVFKTVTNFYQRFINMAVILLEIGLGLFLIIMPFSIWTKVFKLKWDWNL